MLDKALNKDHFLRQAEITIKEPELLLAYSGGDARKLLNILELVVNDYLGEEKDDGKPDIIITNDLVKEKVQEKMALYDKNGEQHYDIISAFIKSIRGSDPNAAVYWLARMVEGGEKPEFIARRLVILAAEDIGLANPNALLLATSAFQAVHMVGWPESRIILSEAALYLATSPKSNSSIVAIDDAQEIVRQTGDLSVPMHIRNAPTRLMKELRYGKDYKYAHSYEGNFIDDDFLPEAILNKKIYDPQDNTRENEIRQRLRSWWKDRYGY